MPARLLNDLNHHDLSWLGFVGATWFHQNVLADALIFRDDGRDAMLQDQATDDLAIGAFQYFNYRAFRPSATINATSYAKAGS